MKHFHSGALLAGAMALTGVAAIQSAPIAITSADATPDRQSDLIRCVEGHRVSALFAPGTDPEIVANVSQAIQSVTGDRFQVTGRWPGLSNTPVTITYSFPADGINIPSGVGEGSGSNVMHSRMNMLFGSEAVWKQMIRDMFDEWAFFTGNTYVEVPDDNAPLFSSPGPLHGGAGRGDVRITAKNIDGSSGTLAYNFFPASDGGDMVLDSSENWGSPANDFRLFRNTLSHEHGHGAGVLHVCPVANSKLMEPFLNTNFDGLQHDDIRAAVNHYGDRFEPNNNTGDAWFLGAFSDTGAVSEDNLAIRNGADDDYFSFEVANEGTVSVTADPFGFSYQSGPQDFFCSSGATINSNTQVNLQFAVYDTDGSTALASANSTGFGSAETLTDVALPGAGTYYIRVFDAAVNGDNQIYDLDVDITVEELITCVADFNGDGVVDTADLGLLIDVFGTRNPGLDLNGDGEINTADLGILISVFGTCTSE